MGIDVCEVEVGAGSVNAQLLLCVSIRGSIASANRFSSHVVKYH